MEKSGECVLVEEDLAAVVEEDLAAVGGKKMCWQLKDCHTFKLHANNCITHSTAMHHRLTQKPSP